LEERSFARIINSQNNNIKILIVGDIFADKIGDNDAHF
jgi:hypothetical protein